MEGAYAPRTSRQERRGVLEEKDVIGPIQQKYAEIHTGGDSDVYAFNFATDDEYAKFLESMTARSNFNTGVEVSPDDHIMTLSTCAYDYDDARYVVLCKIVPISEAGSILKKIHSVPLEEEDVPIKTKKEKKLLQLAKYEESGLRIPDDEIAIRYVKENIDQIWKEPPAYLHGDFHPGNLIYMQDGSIGVIDFNRWEVGDPFEEFYKLENFGIESSIPFCIGQIDAYFDDSVPMDFWIANAVYVAQASLFSIKWAEKFGQREIDGMVARAKRAFADFDGFKKIIPCWYSGRYSD